MGDSGAIAVAAAIGAVICLITVDLSGNDIGERGALALYDALCSLPKGSRLRSVKLDDNPMIPPALQMSIQTQALSNNLATIVQQSRDAPPPKLARGKGSGKEDVEQDVIGWPLALEQPHDGIQLEAAPLVSLREAWLSIVHMPVLRTLLGATPAKRPPIASLRLHHCQRVQDNALATLLAPPNEAPAQQGRPSPAPSPTSYLRSLRWLHISKCNAADLMVTAVCEAAGAGHLDTLVGCFSEQPSESRIYGYHEHGSQEEEGGEIYHRSQPAPHEVVPALAAPLALYHVVVFDRLLGIPRLDLKRARVELHVL